MYIDAQLQFASAQTLGGDAASENVIDLRDKRDVGVGRSLYIVVTAKTALTGTLQVNLEGSVDEAFSAPIVKADLGTFAAAAPAGSSLKFKVSPDMLDEKYARLDFNGATGGDVDAAIVLDIDAYTSYPNGYTITG